MSSNVEHIILSSLVQHEEFSRSVLPFLKHEYFHDRQDKEVFLAISRYWEKYNTKPTSTSLTIDISNAEFPHLNDEDCSNITDVLVPSLFVKMENEDIAWLRDTAEAFCKDKAVYNALMESIQITDEKNEHQSKKPKSAIPTILSEALSVTFDPNVGHDFLEDADERFEFYHKVENKIPYDLDYFNRITGGGMARKTLTVIMSGTNVGKTLWMCHVAASCLSQGNNVLYITAEMAEERIAERVDANLLDVTIEDLHTIPKDLFDRKMTKLKAKTDGRMIIKEYPTATAHVGHFRALCDELRLKQDFVPDVIFVDYINICLSSRLNANASAGSYFYIKAIAEEFRGLAVELDVPMITATQVNRAGFTSTDFSLADTAESFGLPATADLMFGLFSTDELADLNQFCVKQLKNRFDDPNKIKRFVIGVDKPKMKLYDVAESAQKNLVDTGSSATTTTQTANSDYQEPRKYTGMTV